MSKLFEVERCLECPYQSGDCKMCMKMLRHFDSETEWDTPFPEWCPLKDRSIWERGGLA